jgi:serine/threonine protein kinase
MSCNYILKNGNICKNSAKKSIKSIDYCTRHYNLLSQNSDTNNTHNINEILFDLNQDKEIIFINKGAFGTVYKIFLDDKYYALKIQYLNNDIKNIIYYEYLLLSQHFNNCDNIVKLYNGKKSYYCKNNEYSYIITELLYETLEDRKQRYQFTIDKIKEIGIQLIQIIKYIHDKKYLYIDLKPENIMFINENENVIKLIDFNCCSKYINHLSEFYNNSIIKGPIGNMIYSSININKSYSGIRIDDIESILWILLYLLDYDIVKNIKKAKKNNKIITLKENFIININGEQNIHDFIIYFVNELKTYNTINNKKPNYEIFINILK